MSSQLNLKSNAPRKRAFSEDIFGWIDKFVEGYFFMQLLNILSYFRFIHNLHSSELYLIAKFGVWINNNFQSACFKSKHYLLDNSPDKWLFSLYIIPVFGKCILF